MNSRFFAHSNFDMNGWLIFICAFLGSWLGCLLLFRFLFFPVKPHGWSGKKIQGYIPAHKDDWIYKVADLLLVEIEKNETIPRQLASPLTLEPLLPTIEQHVDEFLNHKLGKAMPVVNMFVGERTLNQMKGIFMEELKLLFPQIMLQFFRQATSTEKLRPILVQQLNDLSESSMALQFQTRLKNGLQKISLLAGICGGATGLLLWALALLFNII